jgi:hypothetical protein
MTYPSLTLYPGIGTYPVAPFAIPDEPPSSFRPIVPAVTEYWYDELRTTQPGDQYRGWPLLVLLGGVGVAFGESHDLARDPEQLTDPDLIPAKHLQWLQQWAGVTTSEGTPDSTARAAITSPPAFRRGTVEAIRAAVRAGEGPSSALTGTTTVSFVERNGGPKALTVVTYASETPDPAATARVVAAQVPAWITATHVVTSGALIDQGTRTIDASTATIDAATVADVT